MLIMQLLGKRQATAIYNARMVTIVTYYIISTAYYSRNDTGIDRETGRQAQAVIFALKLGQLLFQLYVQIEGAIEETASRTP